MKKRSFSKPNYLLVVFVILILATVGITVYSIFNRKEVGDSSASHPGILSKYQEPKVWFSVSGRSTLRAYPSDFYTLFTKPESWAESRKAMDTYVINSPFTLTPKFNDEAFLKTYVATTLKGKEVSYDTIYPFFMSCLPAKKDGAYMTEDLENIRKLIKAGVNVTSIKMQSILEKPVENSNLLKQCPNLSLDDRIDAMIQYSKYMHKYYPNMKIGLTSAVENYHLSGWEWRSTLRKLHTKFVTSGERLSFLFLDAPYELSQDSGSPHYFPLKTIKELENLLRDELGIKFGLILTAYNGGLTSDKAYYDVVTKYLTEYQAIGGHPDYYFLESWQKYPETVTPENSVSGFPFTKTLLNVQNIVNRKYISTPHTIKGSVSTLISADNKISGWAESNDVKAKSPLTVKLFIDSPYPKNSSSQTVLANIKRSQRNTWFTFSIPSSYKDGKYHVAYIYVVSPIDNKTLVPIDGSGFIFKAK